MTALLVSASGGHLAQLHRLASRLDVVGADRVWATFDGPQIRTLLKGEEVHLVPYVGPRELGSALRNTRDANRILRRVKPSVVVSTGSAVAMSFLPLSRLKGIPTLYIESAARADGPSLTGRLLQRMPGIMLATQYEHWHDRKWQYIGSVFDGFRPVKAQPAAKTGHLRVVVTLGLIEGYGFRRLVQRLLEILPLDAEVLWQVGDTNTSGLPITAVRSLPWADLVTAMEQADVVVAHTGIGSAIDALEAGKCPVLVPREARFGEHVDNHQRQIAEALSCRGLAIMRSAVELTLDDLHAAMRVAVEEQVRPSLIKTFAPEVVLARPNASPTASSPL